MTTRNGKRYKSKQFNTNKIKYKNVHDGKKENGSKNRNIMDFVTKTKIHKKTDSGKMKLHLTPPTPDEKRPKEKTQFSCKPRTLTIDLYEEADNTSEAKGPTNKQTKKIKKIMQFSFLIPTRR